jgi:hypothetical protein
MLPEYAALASASRLEDVRTVAELPGSFSRKVVKGKEHWYGVAMMERDRVVENWLAHKVGSAYDALKAEPKPRHPDRASTRAPDSNGCRKLRWSCRGIADHGCHCERSAAIHEPVDCRATLAMTNTGPSTISRPLRYEVEND